MRVCAHRISVGMSEVTVVTTTGKTEVAATTAMVRRAMVEREVAMGEVRPAMVEVEAGVVTEEEEEKVEARAEEVSSRLFHPCPRFQVSFLYNVTS